ncbi:unnamed protein product [Owenia fusiformis]|uniref:Lipocalin/cytosolic fatty-acid binding domain-containing protein n=1 Tax=Owenia fusiformis TaxID=6347 RepID=A0A8S4N3N7_OWEFU|nr:unnamed protein product [Owenia fusiformis]
MSSSRYQMVLGLVLLVTAVSSVHGGSCPSPSPAKGYTDKAYYGLWYEIGKIQTAGGAYFEKDCVCTTINVKPKKGANNGDATAVNSCRKLKPNGDFLNATGSLTNEGPKGKWKEGFFWFTPKVDYTIIELGPDFAVEFDCGSTFGLVNYCIHILSRTPTQNKTLTTTLLKKAINMGLNVDNLDFKQTLQDGCW